MKPPLFKTALREIAALGDEAHYEGGTRYIRSNAEASAILDCFDSHAERGALAIAYMDAFDKAKARQDAARFLGVPAELRA
jgi:hypothetical protein